MKRKVIDTIKSELKTSFNIDKLTSIIAKICKEEFGKIIASNTMDMITITEYIEPGWNAPLEYIAIMKTYKKIFCNKFKIDYISPRSNRNLFKESSNTRVSIEVPKQGVYYKQLDPKTILVVIVSTDINPRIDDEHLNSICRVEMTQTIIGGNRKKWKTKIIQLNDCHFKKLEKCSVSNIKRIDVDDVPVKSPIISINNISKGNAWSTVNRTIRPLENIVFPQKNEILEKIENFIDGSDLYYRTSIPYKIGILLHGNHGTGKTSFALALAHKYNIPISTLDLSFFDSDMPDLGYLDSMLKTTIESSVISYRHLHATTSSVVPEIVSKPTYRIILIDEIDAQLSTDELNIKTEVGTKIINKRLIRLLNALDSIGNGAIVIATTNHIECLTPKLIRSGRFDYIYELNNLDRAHCYDMIKSREIDNPDKILEGKSFPYNPADLEQDIISHIITEHKLCNTHKVDIKELMGDDVDDVESNSTNENNEPDTHQVSVNELFPKPPVFAQDYSFPVMPDDF